MEIAKQTVYALLSESFALEIAKQSVNALMVYPQIDVGKQVVYVMLVEPHVEAEVEFVATASLNVLLGQQALMQFTATATLSVSGLPDPPWNCGLTQPTTWTCN